MLQLLSENLPLIISGVIVPLVAWFIKTKVESDKTERILLSLNDAVGTAVAATAQTYISEIKKAKADGKLTDEEKRNARHIAIQDAKRLLGKKVLGELRKMFGDEDIVISSKIEAEVADRKLNPL